MRLFCRGVWMPVFLRSSSTPQQMKHYEEMYHDPQLFFLLGKTLCVEHTTPEEYAHVMTPPPNTKESYER